MSDNLPPQPETIQAPPATPATPPRGMAVVAGVLLVASVVALALAWRADQRVGSLEQELVRRQQDSAKQAVEAQMLAKQANEGMGAAAAKVALLEARVAEVALQRTQLEDLIQSLSRSRDENLLVDIEAALRMAIQQGAITGSTEPLVLVLRQSDERLARYSQPRLEGVRRAIARDLDRVKSAGALDIASLTIKLDEAMRMVDELPLLATAVPSYAKPGSGQAPDTEPDRLGKASSSSKTPETAFEMQYSFANGLRARGIRKGDRVVMWYISGNRDESVIENPNAFIIDRERPRHHMSFGFGVHRCVGNRVAELQLTIIWEEILKRFPEIRLLEEPRRSYSIFIKGYEDLKVVIPRRA